MCRQVRIGQHVFYSIIIKCSTVIQDGMIIRPSVPEDELDSYLVAELFRLLQLPQPRSNMAFVIQLWQGMLD